MDETPERISAMEKVIDNFKYLLTFRIENLYIEFADKHTIYLEELQKEINGRLLSINLHDNNISIDNVWTDIHVVYSFMPIRGIRMVNNPYKFITLSYGITY